MTLINTRDYTGYSESSLEEAIAQALAKSGKDQDQVKIIETRSAQPQDNKRYYQATLSAFSE
ncbi:hypothetical protein Lqui_2986 [Legionella quinlivanii]|uniref:Uncharacterized protein n=1 Tax=Legionella quinlivanii TaxID=45073 RepID=A0A0W0XKQ5_9GAMM|nr:hypothetical protein [Legionella quinlivanii]KTD45125.1 hypothetical protein Lqui_2986 [Legionella quinlivanii]MCW8452072.1 hypothetical protein [Legionella quinlivanii]SEG49685.1 hypothetical protein SAMN02746093_03157 [Legionella quinlivanii DSM 21216]STY09729.1 Uncharacterised protein [Legionella quinlivanii]